MKLKSIYPKNEKDKIFRKVETFIKIAYPHTKIQYIKLGKKLIVVKTIHSHIHLRKCDFNGQ